MTELGKKSSSVTLNRNAGWRDLSFLSARVTEFDERAEETEGIVWRVEVRDVPNVL